MPQMGVQSIPVQLPTLLPQGTVGLLLGQGSLTLQGLIVHPGIIDNQHTQEIQVLCSSPKGIFSISKGGRVAQLLLLPSAHQEPRSKQMGCSCQDATYLVVSLQDRPKLLLQVNGKSFEGILDTGADKSIISSYWWPQSWPITEASHSLQGLGYSAHPTISSSALTWKPVEGQEGRFTPYVLPLPVNLWGRDVMHDVGLTLSNEYSPQAVQIKERIRYKRGKGLGRHERGCVEPLTPKLNQGRQGLVFS
ncbi:endogenous retrovirus group K member 7 Pro protein-like [Apodemus sylvaticus]|uniref:endogenous retrovirus group K member 7 Pro protein-like n=1 Tax=Apodemus sylvaticus TaxID=10129 RepID=UPI002242DA4B|nr:endogenous retrovirus group K member 7 Pro protein-like [Apodemus sylvaticus]